MAIEVTCTNIGTDGKPCGAVFTVDEKLAGEMVACKKCKKLVEAPPPAGSGDDPFFDKQSADQPLTSSKPKPSPLDAGGDDFDLEDRIVAGFDSDSMSAPIPEPTKDEEDLFGDMPDAEMLPTMEEQQSLGDLLGSSDDEDEYELQAADETPSASTGDDDLLGAVPEGAGPTLDFTPARPRPSAADATKPCDKCGAELPAHEVVCNQCGWHHTLKQKFDGFIDSGEEPATGFTLWWRENYMDSGSTRGLALLFIGGGSLLFLTCFLCLMVSWGKIACLLFCPLFLLVALISPLVIGYFQGEEAPLYPWNLLLRLLRACNWPAPDWPFAPLKSFSRRGETFSDDDFAEVPGLTEIKALDLEGTQITDDILQVLIHMQQLQYLVIRDTKLTPKTIKSIRSVLAHTWVWS